MKKSFIGLLAASLSLILLGGCSAYQYKSGKLEEITGTYKLKTITKKDSDNNDYSYKDEIGAEAYFTIDSSGYSYYAYKDNENPWKATSMFAVFGADEEKEGYYKNVELTDGAAHKYYWEKEVGCLDEPAMGFNSKTKTLAYTILHQSPNALVKHEIPYQYVVYEKISGDTGVTALNRATGQNFSFKMPFELSRVEGMYVLEITKGNFEDKINPDYGRFEYGILDTDSFNDNKMDFYYSLTSDKVHTKTTATVSYPESYGSYRNAELKLSVTDGGVQRDLVFNLFNGNQIGSMFEYTLWSEPDESGTSWGIYSNYFKRYYGEAKTLDQLITELLKVD